MNKVAIIGAASGLGAQITETCLGPAHMQASPLLQACFNSVPGLYWHSLIEVEVAESTNKAQAIGAWSKRLAQQTQALAQAKQQFVVLGGDHSCAIGTWSGVAYATREQGAMGLVWVDAHLDSHTFETSESGAIHGMPVACLLGYGETCLTQVLMQQAVLKPEHICIIGARSYEQGEYDLLLELGVKVFYMSEIQQRGFVAVFDEARAIAASASAGFGLSIDLDAIDPVDAPGVGSPAAGGLRAQEVLTSLASLRGHSSLLGIEIAEFNPTRDKQQLTEQLICDLIHVLYQ